MEKVVTFENRQCFIQGFRLILIRVLVTYGEGAMQVRWMASHLQAYRLSYRTKVS